MASIKGSSLVEVLVSMVILFTTFAIGMLIFANLSVGSASSKKRAIAQQLQQLQADWLQNGFEQKTESAELTIDSINYEILEKEVDGFHDMKYVSVYAKDPYSNLIIDSLSAFHLIAPK